MTADPALVAVADIGLDLHVHLAAVLREVLADGDLHPSERLLDRMATRMMGLLPRPAPASPIAERSASWFQTQSGIAFYLVDPSPELICIEDISHALSMQCRFNGHTGNFYSVAQHSELVARCLMAWSGWHPRAHGQRDRDEVDRAEVRWGLLHDAAEAYVGDIIRPLKRLLPEFGRFEGPIEMAIAKRFDLTWPMPEMVKRADRAVLAAERKFLRPPSPRSIASDEDVPPWPETRFYPLPPERAQASFIDLYRQLYSPCKEWNGSGGACATCGQPARDHAGAPSPADRGCKEFRGAPTLEICEFCWLPREWHP
jgi:hypothetical protein